MQQITNVLITAFISGKVQGFLSNITLSDKILMVSIVQLGANSKPVLQNDYLTHRHANEKNKTNSFE